MASPRTYLYRSLRTVRFLHEEIGQPTPGMSGHVPLGPRGGGFEGTDSWKVPPPKQRRVRIPSKYHHIPPSVSLEHITPPLALGGTVKGTPQKRKPHLHLLKQRQASHPSLIRCRAHRARLGPAPRHEGRSFSPFQKRDLPTEGCRVGDHLRSKP